MTSFFVMTTLLFRPMESQVQRGCSKSFRSYCFKGEAGLPVAEMSPWMDLRLPPKEMKLPLVAAQTHRRFIKTHLPVDALVFSDKAKYIYIGRDGRDVVWVLPSSTVNLGSITHEIQFTFRVPPPISASRLTRQGR